MWNKNFVIDAIVYLSLKMGRGFSLPSGKGKITIQTILLILSKKEDWWC
jgi:hypothetical protein